MKPSRGELAEVTVIAVVVGATWILAAGSSWNLPLGHFVAYSAVVVLGQGLMRDLLRIALVRPKPAGAKRRIGCLCAESTIGLVMVAAGIGLTLVGIREPITLGRTALTVAVATLLVGGFIAKDFIVIVRREKDHGSVIIG